MKKDHPPPIYVVSGGKGMAGDHMVQSILVQYPDNKVPVILVPDVHTMAQIEEVIQKAHKTGGVVTHTMVDKRMRDALKDLANFYKVKTIDFMGELSEYLNEVLDDDPLERPGLYRNINQKYFDRINAIEFTLSSDDGVNPQKLKKADIILTGLSRAGKTPLSIFLAMYGWKVANVPLVEGIDPPQELFEIDRRRVFGLTISASQLQAHRHKRLASIGKKSIDAYTDSLAINSEIEFAKKIFRKGRFSVINVTQKPIESSATEIIRMMSERFGTSERRDPFV